MPNEQTLIPPENFDPNHPRPQDLVWAYSHGLFPMANPITAELEWFSPDPRAIIPLDRMRITRSLAKLVRGNRFEIRCNSAFREVMKQCARPRKADDFTWIDARMIDAYVALHSIGHAHSVEAWRDGRLVGGLYGVQIGGAFFGESMFTALGKEASNSSKVCLVHLVCWLNHRGFELLDTQFANEHMRQFGLVEVPRRDYLHRLRSAVNCAATWGDFRPLP